MKKTHIFIIFLMLLLAGLPSIFKDSFLLSSKSKKDSNSSTVKSIDKDVILIELPRFKDNQLPVLV